mmetsp:Transcript_64573/g.170956  ORF Transcript_64573/g.170956 Transcript_64573/m.170956 type:complete len:97 (+) Transcript_64573:711-1001(+)
MGTGESPREQGSPLIAARKLPQLLSSWPPFHPWSWRTWSSGASASTPACCTWLGAVPFQDLWSVGVLLGHDACDAVRHVARLSVTVAKCSCAMRTP